MPFLFKDPLIKTEWYYAKGAHIITGLPRNLDTPAGYNDSYIPQISLNPSGALIEPLEEPLKGGNVSCDLSSPL